MQGNCYGILRFVDHYPIHAAPSFLDASLSLGLLKMAEYAN